MKKPVNFGFLDFSTPAKRRFFCERELELNRRLSPGVYLEVVPICARNGKLSLGGKGRPIEYTVKMRLLSKQRFLDQLLNRDLISKSELNRVASVLARFYNAHPPTPEIERWGRIEKLRISTDENFAQTESFVGRTLSRAAFQSIRGYTNVFYAKHRRLFASRIRNRRIRDCHGDLHLEHIHLSSRSIEIFDCIEFNDRLRYIDVANDLAFLAMDLDFHGRPDLSAAFVHRMARKLRDPGLVQLMNFYKCYRACVRGKVENFRSVSPGTPAAQREDAREKASRYFRLALRYAVIGSEPRILVVMGRIGSGKSTLAEALGAELGWPVLSSDKTRKGLAGIPVNTRTSLLFRRQLYSPGMTRRVYRKLEQNAIRALDQHQSLIVDATFSRRDQRNAFRKRVARVHAQPWFFEAVAPRAVLKDRLRERDERAISDARLEDFDPINRSYEPPSSTEISHLIRISTDRAVSESCEELLCKMARVNAAGNPG